ncbi:MAG TPA: transglutaminaseTgpA domain-containing protein, partial [Roseiflexaceae bacterium]|nr:transglutaminaseTgpA domain-containing protein [Roseiflexaceae bacterium]
PDMAAWGGLMIVLVLLLAWAIPLWPGNPLARLFTRDEELPTGIAVLERSIERPGGNQSTVGLSQLPALLLGTSLELGPPEQISLQIRVTPPPDTAEGPLYWRVRLLTLYRGSSWTAPARVSDRAADPPIDLPRGMYRQEVEDRRFDKQLIVGMADVIALGIPSRAERLDDGVLTALAGDPPEVRYWVISRPQALAEAPPPDRPFDPTPYLI